MNTADSITPSERHQEVLQASISYLASAGPAAARSSTAAGGAPGSQPPSIPTRNLCGYETAVINGSVDPKFQCSLCRGLLKNPVQIHCGHRYCENGLQQLLREVEGDTATCPKCIEEGEEEAELYQFEKNNVYPDNAIKRDLARLEARCINRNCEWTGTFRHYQAHEAECPHKLIECPQCGGEIIRGQSETHNENECPAREVTCEYCEERVKFEDMGNHMANCTMGSNSSGKNANKGLIKMTRDIQRRINEIERSLAEGAPENSVRGSSADFDHKMTIIERQLATFESVFAVVTKEIQKNHQLVETLERQRRLDRELLDNTERKFRDLERTVALKDITISELDLRVKSLETTSHTGKLLWKIDDVSRKRQDALVGRTTSIYSPQFYTSRTGYKMCARMYLNGDGMGKGTHISLFFVLLRGPHDPLLPWPFRQKVTFQFIDQNQRENVVDAFRPDPASSSFKRPTSDMNIASGCPLFMPLNLLESPHHAYVKDDTAFILINVETVGLEAY